ncbi:cob(I)yrinic acid a,c-diamide adenosyltransferase [Afifella marina]|uniref:Corrinoid adenosyltransferase n=1 Tax=Afifella marina DSM 2698 TaxID=1120955 RepID=A0A1G5NNW6_AFIMA|nr:cob(I)yrinic acid a,c-diamide adenosyltransferase [Afifella marina]MBK1624545.1 ATP:cob(I)alamin adenosyltransferase [Afifella marina DSM 2698]MBK1627438.1 ATP:cob(I)alamin adenosyltransferase [Afifella marina]MBK5918496.1 ATP:cob(I)alamin adenosyltransferase [Afifella marina]RAI20651.1 ATP:cob(I)alamin adenosyltransferase [Afifella marina DSM 2698]SCZ39113.1 cob(I)alamin adenosyltransferase [Afifella marina DSM 2698]
MVVLNKIYTRRGDDGTTALGTGERRAKYDPRVEAYGTVDETNALLGVVRAGLNLSIGAPTKEIDEMLARIQNDLFDLGADLATPDDGKPREYERLRIVPSQVERLERDIDRLNKELSPLRSFILPGGTWAAAQLHLARTVARRAERLVVALADQEPEKVAAPAIQYLNRLSDFLFVAARWVNDKGETDVLWVPGQNR